LAIKGEDEFYLFMDMRAEKGWVSFNMSSHKWVIATHEYNDALCKMQVERGLPAIKKIPRALLDKLGEMEAKILDWLHKGHFLCMSHCECLQFTY
jgi:hypothetical protein